MEVDVETRLLLTKNGSTLRILPTQAFPIGSAFQKFIASTKALIKVERVSSVSHFAPHLNTPTQSELLVVSRKNAMNFII